MWIFLVFSWGLGGATSDLHHSRIGRGRGREGAGATHELSLILVAVGTISRTVTLAIVTYNVT